MPESDSQRELREYLNNVFHSFATDPPDSDFQRGYLSAMIEIAKNHSPLSQYRQFDHIPKYRDTP